MFKNSLSVRAYHTARRYGDLPDYTLWAYMYPAAREETFALAGMLVAIKGKGKKTAMELLRAGGRGVYEIAEIVDLPIDRVRDACNHFDITLHEKFD